MRHILWAVAGLVLTIGVEAWGAKIYWSTGFGETIDRANLDGSGLETVVHTGNLPGQLALDTADGKVYWTGVQGRAIGRANLDGTGRQFLVIPSYDPEGIALDPIHGRIYWTEIATLDLGWIRSANLDGSDVQTLISTSTGYPHSVELDLVNGYLYWTNIRTSVIHRSLLDGSQTIDLLSTGVSPIDMAIDPIRGQIYWTENGRSNDIIRRANLDGSDIETLVTGLGNPLGIALDVLDGKMYWADQGLRKIQRANLDGTGVEDILVNLTRDPDFIALDVPIPEPTSLLLLCLGGALIAGRRRRSRNPAISTYDHRSH